MRGDRGIPRDRCVEVVSRQFYSSVRSGWATPLCPGLTDHASLVRYAVRKGIVPMDE